MVPSGLGQLNATSVQYIHVHVTFCMLYMIASAM